MSKKVDAGYICVFHSELVCPHEGLGCFEHCKGCETKSKHERKLKRLVLWYRIKKWWYCKNHYKNNVKPRLKLLNEEIAFRVESLSLEYSETKRKIEEVDRKFNVCPHDYTPYISPEGKYINKQYIVQCKKCKHIRVLTPSEVKCPSCYSLYETTRDVDGDVIYKCTACGRERYIRYEYII